jgi:hypothetical protein
VELLQLHAPGAALAYVIPWEGKTVLVSGKIPITITDSNVLQLANVLKESDDSTPKYERSLRLLSEVRPDVWLTVKPKYGQNANVYGREWMDVVNANLDLVKDLKSRAAPRNP